MTPSDRAKLSENLQRLIKRRESISIIAGMEPGIESVSALEFYSQLAKISADMIHLANAIVAILSDEEIP